jgi:hypothetical protein
VNAASSINLSISNDHPKNESPGSSDSVVITYTVI